MNIKRAVLMSALLWVLSLFLGIFLIVFLGFNKSGDPYTITGGIVILFGLVLLFSNWYFKGKVKKSSREGIFLGLTFLIVGGILDTILLIPYYFSGGNMDEIINYYVSPGFFFGVLILIIIPTIMGNWNKK